MKKIWYTPSHYLPKSFIIKSGKTFYILRRRIDPNSKSYRQYERIRIKKTLSEKEAINLFFKIVRPKINKEEYLVLAQRIYIEKMVPFNPLLWITSPSETLRQFAKDWEEDFGKIGLLKRFAKKLSLNFWKDDNILLEFEKLM